MKKKIKKRKYKKKNNIWKKGTIKPRKFTLAPNEWIKFDNEDRKDFIKIATNGVIALPANSSIDAGDLMTDKKERLMGVALSSSKKGDSVIIKMGQSETERKLLKIRTKIAHTINKTRDFKTFHILMGMLADIDRVIEVERDE